MIEVRGNLWEYEADIHVITTNGYVKANGEAVMGRGCAKEATRKFPGIAAWLGKGIKRYGNVPQWYESPPYLLLTMPVKRNWWEEADPKLIIESARRIEKMTDDRAVVVIPRPGCGNGKLKWEDVRPLLSFLPDRFHIITF